VHFLWNELGQAVPMILNGNPYLWSIVAYTVEVAALATGTAIVLGLPLGLIIGLGRFRGRRVLQVGANAGLALPPVLVGAALFLLSVRSGPFTSLDLFWTKRGVFVAQTILAIPYVTALTAAAVQDAAPGLLAQARLLGAGRRQLAGLALQEAWRGVLAAVIAALGTCLSEVAAIAIIGGNIYGYDQTLASATLFDANGGRYSQALAIAIVLGVLILVLMGGLGLVQQTGPGAGLRLRARTVSAP
jgi:tungstate transport system permease protein